MFGYKASKLKSRIPLISEKMDAYYFLVVLYSNIFAACAKHVNFDLLYCITWRSGR